MTERFAADERGVSELVAFVLSFSVIMTAVGFAYLGGYAALADQQDAEQINNAERAMSALEETFDSVERGDTAARAGEVRLRGGTLSVEESATFTVTVGHENGTLPEQVTTGSLTYRYEDSAVAYENGAVVRQDGDGGLIKKEPTMLCTDERAVVSLVEISQRGDTRSIGGETSVEVSVQKTDNHLYYPMTENATVVNDADAATNVTIEVDRSERADEWERWFDDQEEWTATSDGYRCDADAVFVRTTKVDVRLFS